MDGANAVPGGQIGTNLNGKALEELHRYLQILDGETRANLRMLVETRGREYIAQAT